MSGRVAFVLLGSVLVTVIAALAGAAAGYLARRDGTSYPTAFAHAATAFSTTLALAASVTAALAVVVGHDG